MIYCQQVIIWWGFDVFCPIMSPPAAAATPPERVSHFAMGASVPCQLAACVLSTLRKNIKYTKKQKMRVHMDCYATDE